MKFPSDYKVLVRGGGDIASGVIWTLFNAGFKIIVVDTKMPSTIRRTVSFSEAIFNKKWEIEGVKAIYLKDVNKINNDLLNDVVPVLIDDKCELLNETKPDILIDAILAKKNIGTNINMAKLVIGLGPGFACNVDCHIAIETMRGHNLGRIYKSGSPIENTGIPGYIANHGLDRVIYAQADGKIKHIKKIADIVKKDEIIAYIDNSPVIATIDGVLRGLIVEGYSVYKGLKIADIDPRLNEKDNCNTISDKARAIGGAVLLAIMNAKKNNQL